MFQKKFNCSSSVDSYIIIITIKNISSLLNLIFSIVISIYFDVVQQINYKYFKVINYYFIIAFIIINFQSEMHLVKFNLYY
jgi:hypothetical protein